jgi:serine phosphatase RsbU (regulator of sigma subunit)
MFVTQGPVDPESPLFVGRSTELSQMETWLTNVRCVGAVMGARQTGKTSLLLKLRHLLREKYAFVFIDLEAVAGADMGECVEYIASEITSQLPMATGRQEIRLPEKSHEFQAFLERCARSAPGVRIVVLLDEIGALLPETTLRLTSAIRAVFTSRHVKPELARYVFVIAGATDMLDIATGRNSPLKNVAETLYVGDLPVSDTERLVAEMFGSDGPACSETLVERVHGWTGGHPYWTQRLGETLHREAAGLTEVAVKGAVEQLLLTEDRNLPHIFRALEADQTLTNMVKKLVGGAAVPFTRADQAIARLELIGLAKNDGGQCVIRNRIYQEALGRRVSPQARLLERDLRHLTGHLLEADDVDTLFQAVAVRLQTSLQNESVLVLKRRATDGCYITACSIDIPTEAARGLHFREGAPLLSTLVAPAEPGSIGVPESEADLFTGLNISLVVPARLKGTNEALFCLGRRASGDEFDAEDREFLAAVGAQTAVCLDRLRLRMWEREARDAWLIQKGLLPDRLPSVAGFQIAGSLRPARMVGGDYYDAFELGDRALALCVGDVAGKGMPAALLMASLQAAVRALSSEAVSPSHLCGRINQLIARNVAPGKFITFFFAVLDLATRQLVYTNAGHNPPILFSGNGVVRLSEGGPILGVFPEHLYRDGTVTLRPGDRLLLFTDGVTEAWNDTDEEFGDDRLIALVEECPDAALLHQRVIDSVTAFSAGDFRDDVTVLAITA